MLSRMKTIAQRQKRNSLRDAIVGAAFVLLVGFQAVAFSGSSMEPITARGVEEPVPTQVEDAIDPEQLICTPESVAAVC